MHLLQMFLLHMFLYAFPVPLLEAHGTRHSSLNIIAKHALFVFEHQFIIAILIAATLTPLTSVVTELTIDFNVI